MDQCFITPHQISFALAAGNFRRVFQPQINDRGFIPFDPETQSMQFVLERRGQGIVVLNVRKDGELDYQIISEDERSEGHMWTWQPRASLEQSF